MPTTAPAVASKAPTRYIGSHEIEQILFDAFGVITIDQIRLRFTEHIPHAPVVVPLMRMLGGDWGTLLRELEAFTAEQRAAKVGAGVGYELVKEAERSVKAAQPAPDAPIEQKH